MRLPVPFSGSYESTRHSDTEQRTVNYYPHPKRGWRQFPGLTLFSDTPFDGPAFSEEITGAGMPTFTGAVSPNSFIVSDDGTKAWISASGDTTLISEWDISPAWDLSSISGAAADRTFTLTHTTPYCQGFQWGNSGAKFYVTDQDDDVYQYTASTPYKIDTLSFDSKQFSMDQDSSPTGICFNTAGDKAFMLGQSSERIYAYTLSTPWDISTASYDGFSKTLLFSGELGTAGRNLACNPSLSTIIVSGNSTGVIYQYTLSTPEDPSTGTLDGSFDGTSKITSYQAVSWSNSGNTLYTSGTDGATAIIVEWSIGGPYTIAAASAPDMRGAINMSGVLYAVIETGLWSINSVGVGTLLGTVLGSARVVLEEDGTQLTINTGTSGNTIYVYTVAGGLVTVTDADIEDDALSSAYIDLKFYHDQAGGNFIGSSNNAATVFSLDDKAEAESFSDSILRMYAHNQLLYAFGQTSTEAWYTSGVGRPPVDRQQVIERGIIGTHAIDSIDDMIFFVDQYTRPNRLAGLQYEPIYAPGVAEEWSTYATVSDCVVSAYSYNQQNFVDFIFPTEDASWTYHVSSGQWCEREDVSNGRFRAAEYINVYNKLLLLDRSTAKIYEFSETTYQDDSANITRIKDTGVIDADLYATAMGAPEVTGNELACNSLHITVDATSSGGLLTVTLSKDGAAFGQSRTMTLASGVQTRELTAWGKFREGIFRITTTSNIGIDLVAVAADLEVLDV